MSSEPFPPQPGPGSTGAAGPSTTPPGAGPTPPAGGDRFFDSVRRTGLYRSEDRWVGGVASGVADRLGWDPLLVRGLLFLSFFLSGVGLVLYGIGWALLPEQRDGRIHLQRALHGDFDVAILGAAATTVVGFAWNGGFGGWWDGGGWDWLVALVWIAVWGTVVWLVVRYAIQRRDERRAWAQGWQGPMPAASAAAAPAPGPSYAVPAPAPEHADEVNLLRSAADSSIRVDVEVLDELMRQVGELVLTRNRIGRIATDRDTDTELVRSAQQLNLIAAELQEGVMRTRMQPIEHVWSKMPRVVRDLAAACGREVGLQMAGGDTELDRGLLEAVKDPLTHLVRNAVDHGIEPPVEREAAGKERRGTLTLRAYHAGGQVVVEVQDDGRGVDTAKVAAKAVAKGLRTAEQVAAMGQAELLQLLFLPGFSTAEKVTNVSGRGVGMDVVRTHIEAIGGTVDVESTLGVGTLWRLRIPLTLAIMPSLTVECEGDVYALPQVHVVELVALDAQRAGAGVEYVHESPVYRLRGELLPLVPLASVLDLDDAARVATDRGVIVVVRSDTQRIGLLVDRVLSTEEIVVTPLSPRLRAIGVYSGATVLGDGAVALILDLQAIARSALLGDGEGALARAAQAHDDRAEARAVEQVLVAGVGGRRLAMPLGSVARLESLRAEQVEHVGGREVVRYRGSILPLARLDRVLGAFSEPREDLLVVVYTRAGRSVGLVVDEILDIVDDDVTQHSDIEDIGLVGSTVIGERVTELLDVRSAVLAADPDFEVATAAADEAAAVTDEELYAGLVAGPETVGAGR